MQSVVADGYEVSATGGVKIKHQVVFVLGGPGSGKGTQVRSGRVREVREVQGGQGDSGQSGILGRLKAVLAADVAACLAIQCSVRG